MLILPTDALLWLLVLCASGYGVYVRRHDHLLAPWRRVGRSAIGMSALVVLSVFIAIALLDSLHYRADTDAPGNGGEVRSVLDNALSTLLEHGERTYSAPLATRAYAKETIEDEHGAIRREFPRLNYGGAQLRDEAQHARDIAQRAGAGALIAAALGLALIALFCALRASMLKQPFATSWRALRTGQTQIAWRSILVTMLGVLLFAGVIAGLATNYHVLGTDKVGQDVLYLSLKSIRTGVVIGGLTSLVMLPVALLAGLAAGYFKGWIDDVVQYIYTVINSIPGVLLIAAAVLMVQVAIDAHPEYFQSTIERADVRLLMLCVILGLTSWTGLARLLRGEALKLRELEYVLAARSFGVSHSRILSRHLLPNVMHLVLISVVMDFSGLVLAEAVLSYVGVGVDPTMNSFGTMINAARLEMAREPMVWWMLAAAFFFMFALVLAANLFADAVTDAFDPRQVARGATTLVRKVA
jgi:peptide/nickel transport system permease protein